MSNWLDSWTTTKRTAEREAKPANMPAKVLPFAHTKKILQFGKRAYRRWEAAGFPDDFHWERTEEDMKHFKQREQVNVDIKLLPLAEWHGLPCPYCENPMIIGTLRAPTRDHILPRSRGGTLSDGNKLIVCKPCNGDKGDKTMPEFLDWLRDKADQRAQIVNALIRGWGGHPGTRAAPSRI